MRPVRVAISAVAVAKDGSSTEVGSGLCSGKQPSSVETVAAGARANL